MEDEEEWEEEEQLVVAELSGVLDSAALREGCQGWGKVLGLDSAQPVLQLGRYVFSGGYEDAVGTCVIFQEEPGDREEPSLRYKCHTTKKLVLQRTFLSERKEGEPGGRGIEVLPLNEEDVSGRATAVCHNVLDPSEMDRAKNDPAEPDLDPERPDSDPEQRSWLESCTLGGTGTASDDQEAGPSHAQEH